MHFHSTKLANPFNMDNTAASRKSLPGPGITFMSIGVVFLGVCFAAKLNVFTILSPGHVVHRRGLPGGIAPEGMTMLACPPGSTPVREQY